MITRFDLLQGEEMLLEVVAGYVCYNNQRKKNNYVK